MVQAVRPIAIQSTLLTKDTLTVVRMVREYVFKDGKTLATTALHVTNCMHTDIVFTSTSTLYCISCHVQLYVSNVT